MIYTRKVEGPHHRVVVSQTPMKLTWHRSSGFLLRQPLDKLLLRQRELLPCDFQTCAYFDFESRLDISFEKAALGIHVSAVEREPRRLSLRGCGLRRYKTDVKN